MRDKGAIASDINRLIEENTRAIVQLANLVSALLPDQYQRSSGAHGHHTIGKHVRHVIDHYDAFLRAMDEPDDRFCHQVSYEQRDRLEALETQPAMASGRLGALCRSLSRLGADHHEPGVSFSFNYCTDAGISTMNSSIGRELAFLSSHTIHHMAIIGLLAEQQGIQPTTDFGVHPSTLRHWQKEKTGGTVSQGAGVH